jgi:diacylglycerol kinase (ATP)
MVKPKLIVNPASGTDSAPDHLVLINQRLRDRFGRLDIVITTGEEDARVAARQAVEEEYDCLVVAGGDGTLNEVINGAAEFPDGLSAVTFGVIPLGTGNDFATALGIPTDVEDALQFLADGEPIPVDVCVLNDRHFVNVSAGGFIAEVSEAVDSRLKTVAGKFAYLIGGAKVLLDYVPVKTTVELPLMTGSGGQDVTAGATSGKESDLYAFAVCNSRMVGAGRLIAPDALVDDGQLDVCLIRAMSTLDFVALLRQVSDGEHVADDRVSYFRTPAVDLRFDRAIKVNTDGQVLDVGRCSYRVLPRAARFLASRAATDVFSA